MKQTENKFLLLYLIFFILLMACKEDTTFKRTTEESLSEPNVFQGIELDTILERNNPSAIDFEKHQIFIDTTRSFRVYEDIRTSNLFKLSPNREENFKKYVYSLNPKKVDIEGWPRVWREVKKLNNQFYIYDGCDGGGSWSFAISDSVILLYSPHELNAGAIQKLCKSTPPEIAIEFKHIIANQEEKGLLKIKHTQFPNVYALLLKLKHNKEGMSFLVTPQIKVDQFDMIINNCPTGKVPELNQFERISYLDY